MDPTHPPPFLKNRYRLLEERGQGSMGLLYRARDETLGREVAIKFLPPERVAGPEASARFLREARIVARMAHPNIMALHDVDREGAWHYLVLEYIPGRDLHSLMVERGGPLPLAESIQVVRLVLEALGYAHAQGVVHRDIKPENIMLTPEGQVKVTDFGLAQAGGDVRLTQAGTIVGTVLYMAPEMVSGATVDQRADLYAVGAVLYELLTGRPPFVAGDALGVLSQILNSPVPPPRSLLPALPLAVESVILRLLAKDPAQRYASAEEVLAALPGEEDVAAAMPTATEERSGPVLSLLERIVRSSAISRRQEPAGRPAEEGPPPAGAVPGLTPEVLLYAALEDTAAALEAERRRLAGLLQGSVLEPLNLLLAQARAYEQTLGANPQARMAVSVLTTLARQAFQQAHDLEANLRPVTLESLGLEPALEALASQEMRAHGLQVRLEVERLRERLPAQVELALFRLAQDALGRAAGPAHASQVSIRLECRGPELHFGLSDDSTASAGLELLRPAGQRLAQLGAAVTTSAGPRGGLEIAVRFTVESPAEMTPREMEVLALLVEGLSNKEIARALGLSPRTVNFHLDNIYSKLGVCSRTEAAIYALRHGWVARPPNLSE